MGSANYAVIHLLFKVKEQNFCISVWVFFILAVEKGEKAFSPLFPLIFNFFFLIPMYIPQKFNIPASLLPHELKGLFRNYQDLMAAAFLFRNVG